MGIKLLNKFLRQFHLNEIIEMPIHHLYGKKIAVDASIYLYKCKEDGQLIPNIYFMCSLFRKHNITPIFIFDGKPPIEKKNILIKRKIRKNQAKQQFLQIKEKIKNASQIEMPPQPQEARLLKHTPGADQVNMANDPRYAARRKELETLLRQEMQRLGDPYQLADD